MKTSTISKVKIVICQFIFFMQPYVATGHPIEDYENKTALIENDIPNNVEILNLPDTTEHYQTLNGTHFSVRCYVPYILSTEQAAIQICNIYPVTLEIISWPETEVINLTKGHVEIIENNGEIKHYSAGDIFILPQGFKGEWRQSEMISKIVVRHPLYWK